jgi:DNA-binding response OmpR family regulator
MRPRVLVAEDDRTISLMLVRSLQAIGCEVVTSQDGLEALELGLAEELDLAILDNLMPGMLGVEVLQRWRRAGRPFPVIMLSALSDEEKVVEGLVLGADDYMRKPFSMKELLARVRKHLPGEAEELTSG